MSTVFESVVLGAGLNGLTAAACLARAGRRVLVLEKQEALGGSAVPREFAPGYRAADAAPGWLDPAILKGLGLPADLMRPLPPVPLSALAPDGRALAFTADVAATAQAIGRRSARDAARWPAFAARMARLAGFLEALYRVAPPRPMAPAGADLWTMLRLGLRLRGLGKADMVELLRVLPMSAAELLDDWFDDDLLKGTLGLGAIRNIRQGPRSAGTGFVLLHHHLGQPAGIFSAPALVRHEALAGQLAALVRAAGGEVRSGAPVSGIVLRDGRVDGVVLGSGEEIRARRVASSLDPRRTMLGLVGPQHLEPEAVDALGHIKFRGIAARVHLALAGLPAFQGLEGGADALRGVITLSPGLDALERAYDDAKYGRVSADPALEASLPSLDDPGLAPPGRHVMTIAVQYAPHTLRAGAWDDTSRGALADRVVAKLEAAAPGLGAAILHRAVVTPADLEERYGATEGHLLQGELTLDQILFMRPVPGWGRYRTPVPGLWLCGSGTHPAIAGSSGRNAAREMLRHD